MRPLDRTAEKWRRRSLATAGDYAEGVAASRRPWLEHTLASADKWVRRVVEGFSSDAGLCWLISLPHLFSPHSARVFIGLGGV
ncbi:MAG: hypothetical protein QXJ97_09665 [Desulfurococcaceae archaeon]